MREYKHKSPRNQAKFTKELINSLSPEERWGKTPPPLKKVHTFTRRKEYSRNSPLKVSIRRDPIHRLKKMQRSEINLLRHQLRYENECYATQQTIADDCHVVPKTIQRATNSLAWDGILHKDHRGVKKTNLLKINPEFKRLLLQPWVRHKIGDIIPELAIHPGLALWLLQSVSERNVRQYNIYNNIPLEIDSSYLDFFEISSTSTAGDSNTPGQEISMSIPIHIEAIKSLRLSLSGQVKLAKYSQTAIEYADSQIQKRSNVARPFNYFEKLARSQQELEGEPLDYKLYNDLVAIHGTPADGKELLEYKVIAWDVPKRSPSKHSGASQGNPERDRDAARYTSGSNAQADWWRETMALRNTDHSLYIERIKAYQQSLPRKKKDETTVTRTDLDIAWEHYCQSNPDVIAIEEADPVNYSGYGYKMFLHSPWGSAYLAKAPQTVHILLSSLLQKVYPAQGTTTTDVQPTDPAPQPEATHVSQFRDISVWATHAIQTEIVETPYIDETSPWEEV